VRTLISEDIIFLFPMQNEDRSNHVN